MGLCSKDVNRASFHEITEFVVDDKAGTVVVEDTIELLVVEDAPGAAVVDKSGDPDVEELGPVSVVDDAIGDPELVVDNETAVVEGTACVLEDIAIVVLVVVVTATSQFAPVKPSGQMQLKSDPSSAHSKGSAQGLDEQGVVSQSSPE